jgi:hypothetical protein
MGHTARRLVAIGCFGRFRLVDGDALTLYCSVAKLLCCVRPVSYCHHRLDFIVRILCYASVFARAKGLTRRCSQLRPAPMSSFRLISSSSLQQRALSGAVADLVSR